MRVRSLSNVSARTLVLLVALTLLNAGAPLPVVVAQQASSTMGPQFMSGTPGTYAIRNARIVTVSGAAIESGTVVIRDGKIEAVGASV